MDDHPIKKLAIAAITVAIVLAGPPPDAAGDPLHLTIDSKGMKLLAAPFLYPFPTPPKNPYLFKPKKTDWGWSGDAKNNNRRSELVSQGEKYGSGVTLWT